MSELQGIIHGLDEATYHSHPSLSSTGARQLLPRFKGSPKTFQWNRAHPKTSRAFDLGKAVHAKVLGVGAGFVTYPDEHLTPSGNVSTKAATVQWEQEQRDAGFTLLSPADAVAMDAMSEAVLSHETARPYFEVAVHREVSVFAEVEGVSCRARFDALSDDTRLGVIGLDLKTTTEATPNAFMWSVNQWGYDVQEAFYRDVYAASEGRQLDQFVFVVVQKSGPYEVSVFRLPDVWVSMGRDYARTAREVYARCMESGEWPGYDTAVQVLEPPIGAVIEHGEIYESGEISVA